MGVAMNAAAIRLLAEKGLDAAAIAEVAEALEQKPERSKAAERQARYRARQKEAESVTNDVTRDVTNVTDTPPSLSPNENNSNPHTHPPETKTRARKGHRLPIGWEPKPLADKTAAMVASWPDGAVERELEKFRDWAAAATGDNSRKSDWDAAWRNWLRRRDEEQPRRLRNDRPQPSNRNTYQLTQEKLAAYGSR